ncbi:MAG: hypothetical protein ACKOJF_00780, partial [Planctomycetaceae bacterium]
VGLPHLFDILPHGLRQLPSPRLKTTPFQRPTAPPHATAVPATQATPIRTRVTQTAPLNPPADFPKNSVPSRSLSQRRPRF